MLNTLLLAILIYITNTHHHYLSECILISFLFVSQSRPEIFLTHKYLIFGLQRKDLEFVRMIINKNDKVKCITMRPYFKRITQIRMYQL